MPKLHHANIVLGGGDCRHFLFQILERDLDFNVHKNPDFLLLEKESFGIDEARNLEKWVIGKPLIDENKVALLIVGSITFEAQNVLLKVLEEPPTGTYIFISLESLANILDTLLSRIQILEVSKNDLPDSVLTNPTSPNIALSFLRSNIKEKFSLIQTLSKKEDKIDMKNLIKNLEEVSHQNQATYDHIKNILTAKIFASTRGASPKMLLEWLSCML